MGEVTKGWMSPGDGLIRDKSSEKIVAVFLDNHAAQRAVDCVDACDDIADPSVVPELLEALEKARLQIVAHLMDEMTPANAVKEVSYMDAAIAKARGAS